MLSFQPSSDDDDFNLDSDSCCCVVLIEGLMMWRRSSRWWPRESKTKAVANNDDVKNSTPTINMLVMLFLIRSSKVLYSYEFAIANSSIMDRYIRFICYLSGLLYHMKYDEAHMYMPMSKISVIIITVLKNVRTWKSFPHDWKPTKELSKTYFL